MREIAERYVKLVLGVGQHDPGYVDAYYGDPAWKPAGTPAPIDALLAEAADLDWSLARFVVSSELDEQRATFLSRQLVAIETRLLMLQGAHFPFDEESRRLYDAVAPHRDESAFAPVIAALDDLIPGAGPLGIRYEEYRRAFLVAPDRLPGVFLAALGECRRRTLAHLDLPRGETFAVEYVSGEPWTAYNWFKGGLASLIQVNTDLPMTVDRALDLACHEGYPGHHAYNVLLEDRLVRRRDCVEFTVYPLFSPQSLIAEGTANLGIELAFPPGERLGFEQETLYPLAGIDPETAPRFAEVQTLVNQLQYAGNEAARRYLDGEIDRDAAVGWLTNWGLMPRPQAEQRVRFFERYRSYVINYNLGQDIARAWVERQGGTADNPDLRWKRFGTLLTSPRTPGGLA